MLKYSRHINIGLVRDNYLAYETSYADIIIAAANDSERELRGGRLTHYTHEACEYEVVVPYPKLFAATAQKLDWIAERTETPWNLRVNYRHASDVDLVFSFAAVDIAVMFALTFSGASN